MGLIERSKAVDLVGKMQTYKLFEDGDKLVNQAEAMTGIMLLPSAQPERKTGKWVDNSPVTMKCDQCGIVIKDWDWHRFKICPGCGARMCGGEQDDR